MSNQNPLSPTTQAAITEALSVVRLQPYLKAVNGQTDTAIKIYEINLQLCAALYPSLNIFEVTFRNQINYALQNEYGKFWYHNVVESPIDNAEKKAKERAQIYKIKEKAKEKKRALTPDRIVSELSLGFWSSLITKDTYRQSVFDQCIQKIFPYAQPSERDFTKIAPPFKTQILYLRNRVFHHEPIWSKDYQIEEKYKYLCKVLGWMNPEIFSWIQTFNNFPEVYQSVSEKLNQMALSTIPKSPFPILKK